ncbi:hypothetical protein [Amycolatopsis sp. NPDC051128]
MTAGTIEIRNPADGSVVGNVPTAVKRNGYGPELLTRTKLVHVAPPGE